MTHSDAFPFVLKRGHDVVGVREVTSTHETVHGLIRFAGDHLVIQWRTQREIDHVGISVRTDREVEAVREVTMPISAIANAHVQWSWLRWPPGNYLVLTAADLRAFEQLAGEQGLNLKHPARLEIRVPAALRFNALEFASELRLALAERALKAAETLRLES